MEIIRVGVDLAKSVYQVHGVDRKEKPVWRRQLSRQKWLAAIVEKVQPCSEIGTEACVGAHHWARELQARGYAVKLIAPQFVKPYVKSNKNDRNDAEAICEAMSRPTMRFVSVKSVEQQDIQAMHRIREELVGARTAKSNQIRGLVAEYGMVAQQSLANLRAAIPQWLEDAENGLTDRFRGLLAGVWADLLALEQRVKELDDEIGALAKTHPAARRLQQLRGVGPITATALIATLGSGQQFCKGRDFCVSLGLTPKQHSTGGKQRLLGISKRGDPYLRKLLVHGARAVIYRAKDKDDPLSQWLMRLTSRRHMNVATVALANKTARMAWSMIRNDMDYEPGRAASLLG
jgi:transposase